MKRYIAYITLAFVAVVCMAATASAQKMPERSLVRKGNRQFARERYDLSADSYKRALESAPGNFEATYNLGNAMVRTEQYDKAEQLLTAAAADSLRSAEDRAEAYYNLGNAQFAQQKLKEALASYRRSLEQNPSDMEAKYNYAYTKRLLDNQDQNQNQNQDQNQNQNQDQNQDQNQNQNQDQNGDGQNDRNQNDQNQNDQNKDQNGDQQDQNGQNDPKDQNGDNGDGEEKEGKGTPRSGMSRQQQEQLLDAIQAQEDKTQDKIDEKKKGIIVKGRKNW